MHVISRKALVAFWGGHDRARAPLEHWYAVMDKGVFSNFAELKKAFGSVDKIGEFYVFNIGGNNYRLVAAVHFNRAKVYVRAVMTHDEYDENDWKE